MKEKPAWGYFHVKNLIKFITVYIHCSNADQTQRKLNRTTPMTVQYMQLSWLHCKEYRQMIPQLTISGLRLLFAVFLKRGILK